MIKESDIKSTNMNELALNPEWEYDDDKADNK